MSNENKNKEAASPKKGAAYTPGLKVSERTVITKERKLPLRGNVTAKKGDKVKYSDVVAKTELPGNVELVNIANKLSVDPKEVKEFMLKKETEKVKKGEPIAESAGFFGFFKTACPAPCSGTIESISSATGQVVIRQEPTPVEIMGYIDGIVNEVLPNEGVEIKTFGTYIQGIFGVGGEAVGELKLLVNSCDIMLDENLINDSLAGKIVVGGSYVSYNAIKKAITCKVKGIIAGGIDDEALKTFLGYDLGVAITGNENKGISFVITEGFGKINMAQKTFEILKANEGKRVSINGATQIRAGVIRPEIIIPKEGLNETDIANEAEPQLSLEVGGLVRIIRVPHFGKIATVKALPPQPVEIPTGVKVRVLEVEFENGETFTLPRANVELIERS
ncbi:MAG: hypothetical protein QMC67_09440 [Candidatus Wallbacteria bacterium]